MSDREIASPEFRLSAQLFTWGFGLSFLVHGAVRLPKLTEFAEGLSGQFSDTFIGGWPALSFAYAVPFLEVAAGLLVMLPNARLASRGSQLGIVVMSMIMFGTCLIEKWNLLASQILHALVFLLIAYMIDKKWVGQRQ